MKLRFVAWVAVCLAALPAAAINASNRYRSPRNPERSVRSETKLIILHTTEAPAKSSLNKVSDRGECHFVVTEEGSVYRIVDRDREAFHAGRSMWSGQEDVDKFSIGIECVGYHDKAMSLVQIRAIRDLVKELQSMYKIPDDRVLCHSHVAYGAPNKWHKKKHRGRKRCGMLFAMPSTRQQLGLKTRPSYDPDVRAKRLVVGDAYLNRVLYGTVDTMKGSYGKGSVTGVDPKAAPGSGSFLSWLGIGRKSSSPQSAPPTTVPKRTRAVKPAAKPKVKTTSKPAAKTAPKPASTFKAPPQSVSELKAQGYTCLGTVTKQHTAAQIAGGKWKAADTYYTIRNKVVPGNIVNPARIEQGMQIWRRK